MPYYYPTRYSYNSGGLLLVLICAVFAMWTSYNVNATFKKYATQFSRRRITGAQAAQRVLSANGVHGVRIERVAGNLTDHFDPKTNVIRLSEGVYDSHSTAAIGVACHEAGHAVQYAVGYAPIKLRAAIIPVTNFGTKIAWPLMLLGVLLSSKIEETVIAGKKVFSVADGYLIACFDKDVTEETVKAIAQQHPFYAVFRDSGMATDSVMTNFEQIFETYSPKTVRRVL